MCARYREQKSDELGNGLVSPAKVSEHERSQHSRVWVGPLVDRSEEAATRARRMKLVLERTHDVRKECFHVSVGVAAEDHQEASVVPTAATYELIAELRHCSSRRAHRAYSSERRQSCVEDEKSPFKRLYCIYEDNHTAR